jgi:23S rRNA (cytidine2498-2'-O)-methyltransferase
LNIETEGRRVLVTCDPESEPFALQELRALFPAIPAPQWLDDGIALFAPDMPFAEWAETVRRQPPIFVRHVAPVQWKLPLRGDESDLKVLLEAMPAIASDLRPTDRFTVQARILGEGKLPYRKFTLNSTLSEALERMTGATLECREPERIVSLLCTPTCAYLGLSHVEQNRSAWPGGEHRFKRDDEQISRAEFKLLEAFRIFDLNLPEKGRALDLGAAPGGWTRVLRQRGYQVVAVDPADLDARFRRDAGVQHVRKRVEEYLPTVRSRFALLVNDMRKDPLDSVEILLQSAPYLLPHAPALVTLKLPHEVGASSDTLGTVRLCLDRLQRAYSLIGARQLYHNRSEVTVALRVNAT